MPNIAMIIIINEEGGKGLLQNPISGGKELNLSSSFTRNLKRKPRRIVLNYNRRLQGCLGPIQMERSNN
jgi:hypothetical protein